MIEKLPWRTRFRLVWWILREGRDRRYDALLDCWVEDIRTRTAENLRRTP